MSLKKPLVSIIVPSLNRVTLLKKALDSILNQDYPHIEVIVIDGLSTDGTVSLLKQYGKKINWISEKDNNLGEAINKGIKRAKGEWFINIATDESLYPNSVSSYIESAYAENADIVVGKPVFVDLDQKIIEKGDHPCPIPFEDIICLKYKMPFAASFMKMSIMKKVLLAEEYVVCQDLPFWLSVYNKFNIFFLDKHTATFTVHADSWSSNIKMGRVVLQCRMDMLKEFFSQNIQYLNLQKRAYVAAYLDYFELIHKHSFLEAYFIVFKCFLVSPQETFSVIEERGYEGTIFNVLRRHGASLS